MHFSTIIAASAMATLSVVSAQSMTAPNPAAVLACNTCMSDAAVAAVPICKGLENTEIPKGSSPSEKHKACWCGLTANKTWDDACVKSNTCPAELRDVFVQAIASSSSQPGFCDGVSATSDASASRFFGVSSSTKVAAVGAAALAVAGALL